MRSSAKLIGWPIVAAVAASAICSTAPTDAQTVAASPTTTVDVAIGRGRLINLARPMTDLFVADDKIADVQVRSPTQLYVFGKGAGETTIYATSKGGAVVYAASVRVGANIDSVGQMLSLAMPDAHIVATPMNGLILLTGTVLQPDDAAEAERLVQAYVGDATKVLVRLKTATPLQVNLQVKFAEVSRSFIKNIGVNIQNRASGNPLFNIAQGRQGGISTVPGDTTPTTTVDQNGLTPGATLFQFPNSPAFGTALGLAGRYFGADLLASLDLGERKGLVSTLANPNLTALSGETGTFLAGGEIPIPISQGLGAVSVEYKQYGISLVYTPTVLSDGRISLRVRPEVSQLTSAGAVQINGTTIPALTTRRAETTVELGSGQSLMIGGLLQNNHNNSISQAPGIGDVPVLGALFRSNSFQRDETELVIVITPYLVKPVNANEIVLPTDGYKSPSDLDRVFMGSLSRGSETEDRPKPSVAPASSQPAIGAVSPLPLGPSPTQPIREDAKVIVPNPRKAGSSAAPGFSLK
ncbi:MAG: secretion system protein [Sphingomonas sp. 28-62-20]|uniref:type II and III secretion system protein family protein n=1 Tax=Sphingomonas sp. 28-62-20 TaxID=1970433 RepID=UPI000A0BDC24|nr:MAG: secretion system protein [Proteobacteria bacterium ST_bin13]OYY77952.1 MAG: secretion system protein [Sphingomonas sp. 28-62-20]